MGSFFGDELIVGSYLSGYFLFNHIFVFFLIKIKLIILSNSYLLFLLVLQFFYLERELPFLFFLLTIFSIFIIVKNKKSLLIAFLIFLALTSYIVSKNTNLLNRMVYQTINQIYDFENKKIFFYSKETHCISKNSIKMFKENKILGVGPKNFRNVCFDNPNE